MTGEDLAAVEDSAGVKAMKEILAAASVLLKRRHLDFLLLQVSLK